MWETFLKNSRLKPCILTILEGSRFLASCNIRLRFFHILVHLEPFAYITSTGSYFPGEPVSNDEMESRLGFIQDKASRLKSKILASNGIMARHYAIVPETGLPSMTNAALTAKAVQACLASIGQPLKTLECLACGTSTPDQLAPHHGAMVQGELKAPACEAIGTSGVCCAGMSAFKYAYLNVLSGSTANAISTGSERASAILNARHYKPEMETRLEDLEKNPSLAFSQEFLRWMLSDGAGAFYIEPQPRTQQLCLRIDWIEMVSFAGELDSCMYWGAKKLPDGRLEGWLDAQDPLDRIKEGYMNVSQDVKLLNPHVVPYTILHTLKHIQKKRKIVADDITWFLPHYSSHFFRAQVAEHMRLAGVDIPDERWFTNLSTRGNTGSASIYIMVDELFKSGNLKGGDKVLCYVPESSRFSSCFFQLTAVQG